MSSYVKPPSADPAITWPRTDIASRTEPAPAREMSASAAGSAVTPSCSQTHAKCSVKRRAATKRKG